MTLHWWMHWFWVTLLTVQLVSGRSLAAPQAEELQHITADTPDPSRPSERQGRAMYLTKSPYTTTTTTKKPPMNTTTAKVAEEDKKNDDWLVNTVDAENSTVAVNSTEEAHPSLEWTSATTTEALPTLNATKADKPQKEISLNTTIENTNKTAAHNQNATVAPSKKRNNLTRYPEVKEIDTVESAAESRIVTEKPLSLETTFLQTRIPPNIESSRRTIDQGQSGMDTGEIAGISFGALVLAALAGSTAFVLYRRRYLNKPQTLNDKCSNPDSSGYLDDSTIRDNSEEMYSLDNDSFLNSLEAMTIQNYWTDTVKHTKL